MFDSINDLPISGEAVAAGLIAKFGRDERWLLADIETLADSKAGEQATVLGDLWRGVQHSPITLTTADLCSALVLASQVVSLDMQLESDAAIELLIEDGSRVITCETGQSSREFAGPTSPLGLVHDRPNSFRTIDGPSSHVKNGWRSTSFLILASRFAGRDLSGEAWHVRRGDCKDSSMTPSSISQLDAESFDFNVAHVATIPSDLSNLAKKLDVTVQHEVDDLQEYDVAYLKLDDGFRFYLCKYKSRPENTVDLFFCSQLDDWRHRLEQVSAALGITSSKLLWKNPEYLKTP